MCLLYQHLTKTSISQILAKALVLTQPTHIWSSGCGSRCVMSTPCASYIIQAAIMFLTRYTQDDSVISTTQGYLDDQIFSQRVLYH